MSYREIQNYARNLDQDAKMALAAKVLSQMENQAQNRIVPLNADHAALARKQQEEDRTLLILALVLAGVSLTLAIVLTFKGIGWVKREVEKQIAAYEAKHEIRA